MLTCVLLYIPVDQGSSKGSLSELSTTQDIFVGGFDQILVPSRYGLRACLCLCGLWVWVLVHIGEAGWLLESLIFLSLKLVIIIKIMYVYHALVNTLSTHIIIHINLNTIFYTHVEDSPTITIYIRHYFYFHVWKPGLLTGDVFSLTSLLSSEVSFRCYFHVILVSHGFCEKWWGKGCKLLQWVQKLSVIFLGIFPPALHQGWVSASASSWIPCNFRMFKFVDILMIVIFIHIWHLLAYVHARTLCTWKSSTA